MNPRFPKWSLCSSSVSAPVKVNCVLKWRIKFLIFCVSFLDGTFFLSFNHYSWHMLSGPFIAPLSLEGDSFCSQPSGSCRGAHRIPQARVASVHDRCPRAGTCGSWPRAFSVWYSSVACWHSDLSPSVCFWENPAEITPLKYPTVYFALKHRIFPLLKS